MSDELPPPLAPTWRDRIDELLHGERSLGSIAAAALLLIGIAVAAFALLRPAASAPPPELSIPLASSSSATTTNATAAGVVVHAAGAVARPGLYHLPGGARVDDLLTAAGGLAPDAAVDRINLAAPLTDGQRVYVPRAGETVPADVVGANETSSSGPVDLNAATEAQLDALPGVGPATAKAIIEERRRRGGHFSSIDDLLEVRGIGPAKLDQLRGLVTVR